MPLRTIAAALLAFLLAGPAQAQWNPTPGVPRNTLYQSAIPFAVAPTGSMGNNGAVTLGTALPTTYAAIYLDLPAGAIASGSAAGWYYAVMSSTTVGIVYNDTYSAGQPLIPASPTPFSTTGPGAYSGLTTAQAAQNFTVPAMAYRDTLRVTARFSFPNNADNKTMKIIFGGTAFVNTTLTTDLAWGLQALISNRDSQSVQIGCNSAGSGCLGVSASNFVSGAVNTATAQTLALGLQLATATDYLVAEAVTVEFLRGE